MGVLLLGRNFYEDEKVINAFLCYYKPDEIQREAGIKRTKYYELKSDPEFMKVLQSRKAACVSAAVGRMQTALTRVADELLKIVEDPETKQQIKINAANVLMSQLKDWTTTSDILQRLEALETDFDGTSEG